MKNIQAAAVATMMAAMIVGASAQGTTMPKDTMAKGDSMGMAKSAPTSYTGCVEAGSTAGSYILTHFTAGAAMGADSMGKDGMKADAMKKDAMAKDTMKMDAMAKDGTQKDAMKDGMMKDAMMSEHLMLTSKTSLAPRVGHKVTVTGKGGDKMSFAVSTVKMVASSCQ